METLVCNRDFVAKVFVEAGDLPGFFSLGQDSADLLAKIEKGKARVKEVTGQLDNLKTVLDGPNGSSGKRGELIVAKETLTDACWQKRANLGEACYDAFTGYRNSRARFVEEVLSSPLIFGPPRAGSA